MSNKKAIPYPECEKIALVKEESNILSGFLEWMSDKGYEIAEWDDAGIYLLPHRGSFDKLLADYFDIDLEKAENERRQILDNIRSKK